MSAQQCPLTSLFQVYYKELLYSHMEFLTPLFYQGACIVSYFWFFLF